MFLTPQQIIDEDVGIGDDTIMVGRFINHEGKQKNMPTVRFGSIAMMPSEKVISPAGIAQETFLVEIRSLPGYTGSAVVLMLAGAGLGSLDMSRRRRGKSRIPASEVVSLTNQTQLETMMTFAEPKGPYLLGIDWCHIHQKFPVLGKDGWWSRILAWRELCLHGKLLRC